MTVACFTSGWKSVMRLQDEKQLRINKSGNRFWKVSYTIQQARCSFKCRQRILLSFQVASDLTHPILTTWLCIYTSLLNKSFTARWEKTSDDHTYNISSSHMYIILTFYWVDIFLTPSIRKSLQWFGWHPFNFWNI